MSTWEIEPYDAHGADDDELRPVWELDTELDREVVPAVPATPFAAWLHQRRVPQPAWRHVWRWKAVEKGEVVGLAFCSWNDLVANRDHVGAWLGVAPHFRRRGLGTDLLARVVAQARECDGRLVDLWGAAADGVGESFLTATGAERRIVNRTSVCRTAAIDRALIEGWVKAASDRARDYSLVAWDGPCPEEYIEQYVALIHVMNTAPTENLEREDDEWSEDEVRAWEQTAVQSTDAWWTVCARHDPSGEFAGYTEISFPRFWPELGYQGDTGVWPKHRERGLGRWLKAVNALRVLDERPEVEIITTGNAGSNRAMLAINEAMGFEPSGYIGQWQGEVDVLDAFVGSRRSS